MNATNRAIEAAQRRIDAAVEEFVVAARAERAVRTLPPQHPDAVAAINRARNARDRLRQAEACAAAAGDAA